MWTLFLHASVCMCIIAWYCHRIYITGVKAACQPHAIYSLGGVCVAALLCLLMTSGVLQHVLVLLVLPLASWWYLEEWLRPRLLSSNNKAIFITGCDSGFGRALALRLDAAGVTVFAGCYLPDTSDLVADGSSRMRTVCVDVTSDDDVANAAAFVKENLAPGQQLWGVVNNAGVVYGGELEFIPMHILRHMYDVNCMGQVRVTRAFLPMIRAARGRVVNVASVVGRVAMLNLGGYCMSKFAVEAFTDTLRQEMTQWGVHVSIIEPGPYVTNLGVGDAGRYWDEVWAGASPDVRADYGRHYIDAYRAVADFSVQRDLTPVTSAMEDGLLSPSPLRRYVMGDGSVLLPLLGWLAPGALCRPALLRRLTVYTGATPAALGGGGGGGGQTRE